MIGPGLHRRVRSAFLGALLVLGAAAGLGCLASHLDNGFDLKGPKGIVGYIGPLLSGPSCAFDTGTFDACKFGR